ncbi:hypothetical protein [Chromatocurvus halotolerans]|uniref:Uncharacterized protein n=1 Tax=Chromatocurvus halotolerans TaxID=1132028 RepID=A0A4R2KQ24_9GAMM|nr:hypothetical protein [Chromatocurvus halotolerans]TCO75823.1 hypothetical protein EV688_10612 [Chromatocurvus halotolerans]
MSKINLTALRPHQVELLSRLDGNARRSYLASAAACTGLLIIVPVLILALGLEYALMAHTMNVLLDVGGPDQPVTLLSLSSLLAIVGLTIITKQLQDTRLHDWLARLGLLALMVFIIGFGLIVSLTSFEIAASMLFDPETGLDAIEAWIDGAGTTADPESMGLKIKEAFGEFGGVVALIMASVGLGGVFFISMLVSHTLIDRGLTLTSNFIHARVHYRESSNLHDGINRKAVALQAAQAEHNRLQATSKSQVVHEAVADLVVEADNALAEARYARRLLDLVKQEDRDDPIGSIGLSFLGISEEAFAIDTEAFKAELQRIEVAASEDRLKKIAINVAKGISG